MVCPRLFALVFAVKDMENNSMLTPFVEEYEAEKRKRLGEEGAKPKRIRYKPISR